jgi:hypothetical protein
VARAPRLFLSHSNKDRRFVERLAAVLDDRKLRYWYSRRHIVAARQWHDEIGQALETCNWFVLVLTPASASSKWVKHELLFALERKAYRQRIVVVALKKANAKKLSWTLSQFQWVDFSKGFDQGCRVLLRIWPRSRRR